MTRPNILYIHSHDTGRYVQPYGFAVPTPRLQQLAEEGMLFRQAFCGAPTCSPSRACLLTGQSAHNSGMLGLAHRGFSLTNPAQHLAQVLRGAGYATALAGVQHEGRDAALLGYDQVLLKQHHAAATMTPAAIDFLHHAPAQPFFLSVGFFETYREFPSPGARDDVRFIRPPAPLPDTPQTRADMAAFHASARQLDSGIGAVLDALEETGLAKNTLVICTTDHGIAFPHMKCNLTDHGIGVMLIMRGPGGFHGSRVCDAMVSHIDIYPTLCELLGIDRPPWLQGESLLPLVNGEVQEIHQQIFAEVTYHAAYEPQRAVRTQRWKYIRRFDERAKPVLPNCDDSPSKSLLLDTGWRVADVAQEQLYDLIFDPNETQNLAQTPSRSPQLAEMRTLLTRWMQETGDPLLLGPVPAPSGVLLNDVDGISPQETAMQV